MLHCPDIINTRYTTMDENKVCAACSHEHKADGTCDCACAAMVAAAPEADVAEVAAPEAAADAATDVA